MSIRLYFSFSFFLHLFQRGARGRKTRFAKRVGLSGSGGGREWGGGGCRALNGGGVVRRVVGESEERDEEESEEMDEEVSDC